LDRRSDLPDRRAVVLTAGGRLIEQEPISAEFQLNVGYLGLGASIIKTNNTITRL
jgi:hypothetical protein